MILELLAVFLLIVLNGLLAMSELAVVSARPARLKALEGRGVKGAAVARELAENPGRFFSTVQIGITLVGILAGAVSGATLGARLSDLLADLGLRSSLAGPMGVGVVVMAITYFSLVIGELVPKQIALSAPEAIAARVAPLMLFLSTVAAPLVWLLDRSGKAVLVLLGQSGTRDTDVSDEEIRAVIAEAAGAGVMEQGETEMIAGVMRVADRTARGLMTPRRDIQLVDLDAGLPEILARFRVSGRSRLLLRDPDTEDIVGVLYGRDLLGVREAGFDPRTYAKAAPVIYDALPAMDVVAQLREAPGHLLFVYDEYGHFEGIITAMDILDAIVGGFGEAQKDEPKLVERADGSLLVAGWMPVDEFAERIGLKLRADLGYETVAGLVLDVCAELPVIGHQVEIGGWHLEVVDMDGRRIDKVLATRLAVQNEETPFAPHEDADGSA